MSVLCPSKNVPMNTSDREKEGAAFEEEEDEENEDITSFGLKLHKIGEKKKKRNTYSLSAVSQSIGSLEYTVEEDSLLATSYPKSISTCVYIRVRTYVRTYTCILELS